MQPQRRAPREQHQEVRGNNDEGQRRERRRWHIGNVEILRFSEQTVYHKASVGLKVFFVVPKSLLFSCILFSCCLCLKRTPCQFFFLTTFEHGTAWTAWWCDASRPFGRLDQVSEWSAETLQAAEAATAWRVAAFGAAAAAERFWSFVAGAIFR